MSSELPIQDLIRLALSHHRAGQFRAAQELYDQILAHQPDHADVLQLSGLIAYENKQLDTAIELISRAVSLNDRIPSWHNNLGNALKAAGRLKEAAKSFRRAVEL